jgi:hypothetical protein
MRRLCRPLVGVLLPVAVTFQFGDFLGQVLPQSNHIWVVRSHKLDIVQIVETVPLLQVLSPGAPYELGLPNRIPGPGSGGRVAC